MVEIIKETVTTANTNPNNVVEPTVEVPVTVAATQSQTVEYLFYFAFGALEILLAFRLILKMMGASMTSSFVGMVYGLSGIFVMPFEGIFRKGFSQGVETTSVLEPATIVAMVVYAVIVWGAVKLIRIFSGERQPTE